MIIILLGLQKGFGKNPRPISDQIKRRRIAREVE